MFDLMFGSDWPRYADRVMKARSAEMNEIRDMEKFAEKENPNMQPEEREKIRERARKGETDVSVHGMKLDVGKEPVQQGVFEYFPRALLKIAEVSAHGAIKYSWGNWKKHMEDGINRVGNARARHILKEAIHPDGLDPDSKLEHAAHEAWGSLARLELMLQEKEKTHA